MQCTPYDFAWVQADREIFLNLCLTLAEYFGIEYKKTYKLEIRSTKFEKNSNYQNRKFKTGARGPIEGLGWL